MKSICKKIEENRRLIDEAQTNNRILTSQLIKEYGKVMKEDMFWKWCSQLREKIEQIRQSVTQGCYESGVHNFFCEFNYADESLNREYQDYIDFVFTYQKVVSKVSDNRDLWEHADQFEYMSDDGWYDFTDFLPLQGKDAYDHVINKGGEKMEDGHKPWTREHEGYILSNLEKKLGLYASEGLSQEEEDEIWV